MAESDSEGGGAHPFSSEAAASGGDDGTEAIGDSDEPNSSSGSSSGVAASQPLQRPRSRSAVAPTQSGAAQQQQQQQHRGSRLGLTRRGRGGGSALSSSTGNGASQQQQQQQQQVGGLAGSSFRSRGETAAAAAAAAAAETWERRFSTFRVRCRWTLILVGLFFVILAAGHSYCMVLVLSLIAAIYKEIIQTKERREEERLPDFHLLKWYWFCVTIMGIGLPWWLQRLRGWDPETTEWILGFHSLGVYLAWFIGFIWFILSLRKSYLRYQFSQLGVMLVVLMFVVSQSLIQVANIYSGLIWFFLPTSLVIVNDIVAYLCGTAFGRTRLIRLSPKKTVEGYLGAAAATLLWAWVVGRQLERSPMFICPQPYISFKPFSVFRDLSCAPSTVFVPRCIDTPLQRLGLHWWEADQRQQQELLLLQQQQQLLLQEHQTLMTQAAAADEQLLLLAGQQQQQPPHQEQQTGVALLHQQQQQEQQEQQVYELQQQLRVRLASIMDERAAIEIRQRENCRSFLVSPFDLHAMVLGSFAAFFAPFGGFFASGFKRAVRIKDFGYFIPGHGGVTDRFDCQVVMGLFTFLYQKTFVPQIGEAEAAARLTAQQQQRLLLQQLREQRQQQRAEGSSKIPTSRRNAHAEDCADNQQHQRQQHQQLASQAASQLATGGGDSRDHAIAALLQAAQGLSLSQLANLRERLDAIAAAKTAAGE